MEQESSNTNTVPGTAALNKGISILTAIADANEPPVFSRLQAVTSLPKGTLYRILKALILESLVRYEPRDKTYHLGLKLLSLAYQVLEDMDIRNIARSELIRLRDITDEAVHLAVRDNTKAVYLDVVESSHAVGPIAKLGSSSEFHNSAVGKAIAANLPPEEQAEIIGRLTMFKSTPTTITSRRKLRAHLNEVRRQGYALNQEEESVGIHGIAAPIFGHRGEVIASVCITIPSYRFEAAKLESYAAGVVDAASNISRRMGHASP
jgi:DNA-binding IclR family transcriptional regulator